MLAFLKAPAVAGHTVGDVLAVVGLLAVAGWLLRTLLTLANINLFFAKPRKSLTGYGKWALVTGASDGIGKEYAFALAKKGLNVVIVARSEDKLNNVAAEIKAKFPERTITPIVYDFSKRRTAAEYNALGKQLEGLDIGVLINNVGVSYPGALYFGELETHQENAIEDLVSVNVTSVTQMTRIILPGMLSRGGGIILNLSSAAGRVPIGNPLYAVYSGSKAFVDYFSRSLHEEYASKGVFVQCQYPYFVATNMSKIRKPTLDAPSPAAFARASLAAISTGGSHVVPYWVHRIQDFVLQSAPTPVLRSYLMGLHAGLRKRFLKKQEEKALAAAASNGAPAVAAPVADKKKA